MNRMLRTIVILLVACGAAIGIGACQRNRPQQGGEVHVEVTDRGFEPANVEIRAGRAVTLVMTRRTDATCATEVVFPSLGQHHALPLDQPVRIELPAGAKGTLSYQCGMNMLGGRVTFQ